MSSVPMCESRFSGLKKPWQPETWQDSTMHFSSPRNRGIFSTFWGDFFTKLHRKPGEEGKNPLETLQKIQWRRRPEIADFCPLSWTNVSWGSDQTYENSEQPKHCMLLCFVVRREEAQATDLGFGRISIQSTVVSVLAWVLEALTKLGADLASRKYMHIGSLRRSRWIFGFDALCGKDAKVRRLFVTCGVFTRYFSWLFRGFFVAFSWPSSV